MEDKLIFSVNCKNSPEIVTSDFFKKNNINEDTIYQTTTINENLIFDKQYIDKEYIINNHLGSGTNSIVIRLQDKDFVMKLTNYNESTYYNSVMQGICAHQCNFINKIVQIGTFLLPEGIENMIIDEKKCFSSLPEKGLFMIVKKNDYDIYDYIEFMQKEQSSFIKQNRYINTVRQLLEVVQCATNNRILLLDLYKNNLMFDKNWDLNVIDFGSNRCIDSNVIDMDDGKPKSIFGVDLVSQSHFPSFINPLIQFLETLAISFTSTSVEKLKEYRNIV